MGGGAPASAPAPRCPDRGPAPPPPRRICPSRTPTARHPPSPHLPSLAVVRSRPQGPVRSPRPPSPAGTRPQNRPPVHAVAPRRSRPLRRRRGKRRCRCGPRRRRSAHLARRELLPARPSRTQPPAPQSGAAARRGPWRQRRQQPTDTDPPEGYTRLVHWWQLKNCKHRCPTHWTRCLRRRGWPRRWRRPPHP